MTVKENRENLQSYFGSIALGFNIGVVLSRIYGSLASPNDNKDRVQCYSSYKVGVCVEEKGVNKI